MNPGVYLTTKATAEYLVPAVTIQDEDRSAVAEFHFGGAFDPCRHARRTRQSRLTLPHA
ncbi:hypothetical protein [Shinella kummerowiae]|uniref:hypothetical protein n=1 Tax=Shinella kummerowiae TaxID=417745 RepID=UPI0021B53548|nr:hypothetical protein [Shinella kummerowiae]MCT7665495.1 hypothetical protein [Shinella kummerowiae]